MSLATRCTACATVFRVVQDQLKVSEGWVRCGRCNEVFNALEGLFDLERDTPGDYPAGTRESFSTNAVALAPTPDAAPQRGVDAAPTRSEEAESTDAIHKIDAQLMHSAGSGHDSTPATRVSERDRLEFPDAQFDADTLAGESVDPQSSAMRPPVHAEHDVPESPEPPATPQFVQRAQREARWQSSGMRARQAGAVAALLLALGLQAAHIHRDSIAARWPITREPLAAWCGITGCTIQALRRIDDVVVESTALARAAIPEAFTLSVVLRNRGLMALALPSVDLSLTDANGQLVSRRMFAPRELGATSAPIGPGGESPLQLTFSTGEARVTGYTVEIFYP